MNPEWAESLRDQCHEAGVPFLFKQWGSWGLRDYANYATSKRRTVELLRQDGTPMQMANIGKKSAGRLLTGREHTEFPFAEARTAHQYFGD